MKFIDYFYYFRPGKIDTGFLQRDRRHSKQDITDEFNVEQAARNLFQFMEGEGKRIPATWSHGQ